MLVTWESPDHSAIMKVKVRRVRRVDRREEEGGRDEGRDKREKSEGRLRNVARGGEEIRNLGHRC